MDCGGQIESTRLFLASGDEPHRYLEGPTFRESDEVSLRRQALLTRSDAIAVNNLFQRRAGTFIGNRTDGVRRCIVCFYPLWRALCEPVKSILILVGELEVVGVANARDEHIMLIAREYTCWSEEEYASRPYDEPNIVVLTIHVPSRKEIDRTLLLERVKHSDCLNIVLSAVNDGTIGVALSCKGVALTGSDVRSLCGSNVTVFDNSDNHQCTKKTKKKASQKGGGKKDGFARGMSLRG
jgi:hypothetical protein